MRITYKSPSERGMILNGTKKTEICRCELKKWYEVNKIDFWFIHPNSKRVFKFAEVPCFNIKEIRIEKTECYPFFSVYIDRCGYPVNSIKLEEIVKHEGMSLSSFKKRFLGTEDFFQGIIIKWKSYMVKTVREIKTI